MTTKQRALNKLGNALRHQAGICSNTNTCLPRNDEKTKNRIKRWFNTCKSKGWV